MKRMSVQMRLVLITALFMVAACLALGFTLTRQSRSAMKTLIDERMLDIVNTAAAMLDGDVLEDLRGEDAGTPEYEAVLNTLIRFRDNIKLDYIYYVRDEGNGVFTFGIDPDPVDPADFGEPVVYTDALFRAFQGVPSVDETPSEDQWGVFYSAFSPVYNSEGKVAAVVGADFGTAWYEAQLNQSERTIAIACIFFVCIGIGISLFLTRQYNRTMNAIERNLKDLSDDVDSLTGEHEARGTDRFVENGGGNMQALAENITVLRNDLRAHVNKLNTRANSMISAMASDYRSVYFVDLDRDEAICYRVDPRDSD